MPIADTKAPAASAGRNSVSVRRHSLSGSGLPQWAVLMLVLVVTAGGAWSLRGHSATPAFDHTRGHYRRPPERALPPAVSPHGEQYERTVLECSAGECVVRHYPESFGAILDPQQFLQPGEWARLAYDPGSSWYRGFVNRQCSTSFNCCTYAVGEAVGLTSRDWIDGVAPAGFANPMLVLMESYFEQIASYTVPAALARFAQDPTVQAGDVVCILAGDGAPRVTHAGRVRRSGEDNRLLSKFGPGPVLLSDLRFPLRLFGGNEVRVYRLKTPAPRSF